MLPCQDIHCGVKTRCLEVATIEKVTFRRRQCPACQKKFFTKEVPFKLERGEKNPFTIAHANRLRNK